MKRLFLALLFFMAAPVWAQNSLGNGSGGTLNAASITGQVAVANGGTGSATPSGVNRQKLISGTTYTTPTGTTNMDVCLYGGGGGGGGATSGTGLTGTCSSSNGCAGGSGSTGTVYCFTITKNIASSYTYSIGAGGTAGTCSATPAAGGNGGTTTWTMTWPACAVGVAYVAGDMCLDTNSHPEEVITGGTSGTAPTWPTVLGTTATDGGGVVFMYISVGTVSAPFGNGGVAATSSAVGTGGTAGSSPGQTGAASNETAISSTGSTAGNNGTATTTPALGPSKPNPGGNSASVNGGNTCVASATPGAPGRIVVNAYGPGVF